jgi:tetratricopeptide (TPR) repeat protein
VDRIGTLRDWLTQHPDDRFAGYSLALELDKAGRPDEALAAMDALLRRHPTSGAGHFQRGRILRDLGRLAEARQAWADGLVALAGVEDPEGVRSRKEIEGALEDLED